MKEIQLTKGMVALVDDEDFERVNKFKWYTFQSHKVNYAVRDIHIGKIKYRIRMHNLIMNYSPDDILVDHKDGDGLNNQKYNLRFCTHSQNNMNKRPQIGGSSKYKGVHFDRSRNKWTAQIWRNNVYFYIGRFKTEIEAAKAYNTKAIELFAEFARLNVIETD